jgi:hypothetical protein
MSLVVHEIPDGTQDPCCMCGTPTAFWYEPRDVPLCEPCSNRKDVTLRSLPDKASWARKFRHYKPAESVVS